MNERRLFPRLKLGTPLHYKIRGVGGPDSAICDNISLGGIGFISNKFIAPASLLNLEINVSQRTVRPIGKVNFSIPIPHSDRNRLGIEFMEFDNEERKYLKDFINRRLDILQGRV